MTEGEVVGTVELLSTRYVKSLHSPYVDRIQISWAGVVGDRSIVVVDYATGRVLTAKQARVAGLLGCSSFWWPDRQGEIMIEVPGFSGAYPWWDSLTGPRLYEVLKRRVKLVRVADHPTVMPTNAGFSLRPGVGFDSSPVSWVTSAALESAAMLYPVPGAFDPARLRMTGVIRTPDGVTGFPEDLWVGRILVFPSGVRLLVKKRTVRCSLPTRAQPLSGLTGDIEVLRTLETHHDTSLGIYCVVIDAGDPGHGIIEQGDEVRLV